ncbi:hypothetical protein HDU89_002364, partial [Geranomyces variabilis]
MVSRNLVSRLRLPTDRLVRPLELEMATKGHASTATQVSTFRVGLWPDQGDRPVALPEDTFLIGDLRVDVIVGLPLIQSMSYFRIDESHRGYPRARFRICQNDVEYTARAIASGPSQAIAVQATTKGRTRHPAERTPRPPSMSVCQ